MPPEQDDARARQLEAMRQYVAELGVQRDGPSVEASEPQPASERRRRPSPLWLLLTGLLVVVALVGRGGVVGMVAWPDDRPAGSQTADLSSAAQRTDTTSTGGPMASAGCKRAVDRANAMLASAVRLRGAVAEQGSILRDPASGRLSGRQLLERVAPVLEGRGRRVGPVRPRPGRLPAGRGPVQAASLLNPAGQVRAAWWRRRSHWTGSGRRWRRSPRRRSPAHIQARVTAATTAETPSRSAGR